MRRCIIHIGGHKTGSTSIQHSLNGFADDKFVYAKLDNPNHSIAMFSLFSSHPEKHHIHVAKGLNGTKLSNYISKRRKELERAATAARGRKLIISGEDISVLPEESLIRIRDFCMQHFDDLRIVGYVRPPAALIASVFQERLKAGATVLLWPDQEYPSYRMRFEKFDKVFGRDNVELWKYDPAHFPSGCAVRDFCTRLGISLAPARIVRLNESLSRQVIGLFYTYRKLAPQHGFSVMRGGESTRLASLMSEIGSDKFRFTPRVIKAILDKHRADIKWMEVRLGESLHEYLGAQLPSDIRREADLLVPDPIAIGKLLALLGKAAPRDNKGSTPDEVALLVHAFRKKHASRFFGLL